MEKAELKLALDAVMRRTAELMLEKINRDYFKYVAQFEARELRRIAELGPLSDR